MKVSNYTGAVLAHRGPTKSQDTIELENALRRCVSTGVPQRISLDPDDDRKRLEYRLRNIATQTRVSLSLGAPEDNPHDIVICRVELHDGSSLMPPDQKRHRR